VKRARCALYSKEPFTFLKKSPLSPKKVLYPVYFENEWCADGSADTSVSLFPLLGYPCIHTNVYIYVHKEIEGRTERE